MRKIVLIIGVLSVFLNCSVYAEEGASFFEFRNKIFDESRAIKSLLTSSKKDMIFMNSMWDSCIATMIELDAYFGMLGIFNTIKKEAATEGAVTYLHDWLNVIKNTNEMNIKNLNAISAKPIENNTQRHAKRLIAYYTGLNNRIDAELGNVLALKMTAKKEKAGGKGR